MVSCSVGTFGPRATVHANSLDHVGKIRQKQQFLEMWAVPKTGGFNPIKILLVICSHCSGLKSAPSQKQEEEENKQECNIYVSIQEYLRQIFVTQGREACQLP